MKIECILKRSGGTVVDMNTMVYHFAPEGRKPAPDSPHVCDVTDKKHIARFLSITEAYREAGKTPAVTRQTTKPFDHVEDTALVDPEEMSNKELIDWAIERAINPKNKGEIEDYGREHFNIDLDRRMSPANMIRELLKHDAEKEEQSLNNIE